MACATPLGALLDDVESRRIVTVLFADLEGSTAIGERLNPEAVRSVLTRFYDAAPRDRAHCVTSRVRMSV